MFFACAHSSTKSQSTEYVGETWIVHTSLKITSRGPAEHSNAMYSISQVLDCHVLMHRLPPWDDTHGFSSRVAVHHYRYHFISDHDLTVTLPWHDHKMTMTWAWHDYSMTMIWLWHEYDLVMTWLDLDMTTGVRTKMNMYQSITTPKSSITDLTRLFRIGCGTHFIYLVKRTTRVGNTNDCCILGAKCISWGMSYCCRCASNVYIYSIQ